MCSMHRKDLLRSESDAPGTPRVRPGSPAPAVAMAVVRCTRTVTRSYAVGYARRPRGRYGPYRVRPRIPAHSKYKANTTEPSRLAARVRPRDVSRVRG